MAEKLDRGNISSINKQAQKFIDEFNEIFPDRKLIFLVKAGSHFFDLESPNSDADFRGIYMPSDKEFYEGEARRRFWERKTLEGNKTGVKNTKDDVDFYLYSYTFFLDLLKRGDFNCMELLHAPSDKILINSEEIKNLISFRKNILTNDISAFLGFIKKEYRRYGVNINHYKIQEDLANFLRKYPKHTKLKSIWKDLEEYGKNNTQIIFTTSLTGKKTRVPTIKVAQRFYQNTITTDYLVKAIDYRLTTYGHRQKNMAASGVEFKGLYHALRLIYEANDLFDYGEFIIPFNPERQDTLRKIKNGIESQDEIFRLIDDSIDNIYAREKDMVTNRSQVEHVIDKIKFKLEGIKKINYLKRKR